MKWLRYILESVGTVLILVVLRLLPLDAASAFGSWVLRTVGPHTKVHRVALQNLQHALPQLDEAQRQDVVMRMWDNLGRVCGEYPHINTRNMRRRVQVEHGERLTQTLGQGKPVLLISGHLGNWELLPMLSAAQGHPLHVLYRPANNPMVEWVLRLIRGQYSLGLHAKGQPHAVRQVIAAMRKGEPVCMLVDQKTNDGVSVPLFGREAMTSTAVAQFVRKYGAVVLPARCSRLAGAHFCMQVSEPIVFDEGATEQDILLAVNGALEQWIIDDPAQWFWVHRRWPKEA